MCYARSHKLAVSHSKLGLYISHQDIVLMIAKELNSPRLSEITIFIGFLKLVISRYAMIVVIESMQVYLTVVGEYRRDKLSPNQKSRHICYGKMICLIFLKVPAMASQTHSRLLSVVALLCSRFQYDLYTSLVSGKKGDHVQLGVLSNSGPIITK